MKTILFSILSLVFLNIFVLNNVNSFDSELGEFDSELGMFEIDSLKESMMEFYGGSLSGYGVGSGGFSGGSSGSGGFSGGSSGSGGSGSSGGIDSGAPTGPDSSGIPTSPDSSEIPTSPGRTTSPVDTRVYIEADKLPHSIYEGQITEIIKDPTLIDPSEPKLIDPEKYCPNCNTVKGPDGVGEGKVIPYYTVMTNSRSSAESLVKSDSPVLLSLGSLSFKVNLGNHVLLYEDKPDEFSDDIRGNGVLIRPDAILTARHVAESVENNPGDYKIILIGPTQETLYNLLNFKKVNYLTSTDDPDLAIIHIERPKLAFNPSFPKPYLDRIQIKTQIYSMGVAEFADLPRVASGIITTSMKIRQLSSEGLLSLTSIGTDLRSFPSLSGSPVYLASSGQLVGLVISGVKIYSKTGATISIVGDESEWEAFENWTWIAPVKPFWNSLIADNI